MSQFARRAAVHGVSRLAHPQIPVHCPICVGRRRPVMDGRSTIVRTARRRPVTICRLRATMPGLSIGGAQRAVEDTLRTRLAEQLKRLEVCGSPTAQAGGQVEPESAHAEQRVRTHRGREAVVTPVPLPQYWPISYDPASAARLSSETRQRCRCLGSRP